MTFEIIPDDLSEQINRLVNERDMKDCYRVYYSILCENLILSLKQLVSDEDHLKELLTRDTKAAAWESQGYVSFVAKQAKEVKK